MTLRELERDGFVTRTMFATIPPRVDYELTDLGRELLDLADSLRALPSAIGSGCWRPASGSMPRVASR